MRKRVLIISIVFLISLGVLGFAVQKYNEPASNLIFSFVVEKVAADTKKEILKEYNKRVEYKHLTMYYTTQDESLIPLTQNAIDRGIELNSKFIGSYNEPLDLVLLKNREDLANIVGSEQSSGFHSIDMNMTGILPEDREALANGAPPMIWAYKSTVKHEYTHFVLEHKFNDLGISLEEVPYWFTEGFAEYIGAEEDSITVMEQELLPLEEITTADQWRKHHENLDYNIYLQSYIAVRFLIHTYGEKVILDILTETSITNNFESSFKNVTGIEIDELDYYDANDIGL
ncbi:peptidase MA family metallohydrolase [Planococcus halocryophilus]|uniref:peptidase MA family metallohydrolase n=1 Tax=Planococcus halocryophilus TaxID=1215089 RepID=UPI001F0D5DB8|nr:collagenase [Planococcus halocryophilus]MCH4827945.1 collagenase [Planococcus halocryophilus]